MDSMNNSMESIWNGMEQSMDSMNNSMESTWNGMDYSMDSMNNSMESIWTIPWIPHGMGLYQKFY